MEKLIVSKTIKLEDLLSYYKDKLLYLENQTTYTECEENRKDGKITILEVFIEELEDKIKE